MSPLILAAALLATNPAGAEITTATDAGELAGTFLASPAGAGSPVVVIIPGSGPTDRDGNSPVGVKASTYRLLAEALAERGVATVRIDKRGMYGSASAGDPNKVTIERYAADARSWAETARRTVGAPCAWLLGHSEGALVAQVAAEDSDAVCGVILVSAAGRRMSDVLRAQLSANPANAPVLPQALAAIDTLESGGDVSLEGMHPGLAPLFHPAIQPFLKSLFSYDPADLMRDYEGPAAVIQGSTDLQTTLEDARRLAEARPGVELIVLEGVNHVLKVAPVDRAANFATYADPELPLAPGVADAAASFVKTRSP